MMLVPETLVEYPRLVTSSTTPAHRAWLLRGSAREER